MSSPARSARSSRASTPASDQGIIVSPRSKIQAMLAEIDADSEGEELSVSNKSLSTSTTLKPAISISSILSSNAAGSAGIERDLDASENGDDEEDDEDEPVVRPRGRLAARMGVSIGPFHDDDDSDSEQDAEEDANVYQRIRREMLAEKPQEAHTALNQQSLSPSPSRRHSPPRRRLASRAQQIAKSPAASTRSESPGLFMSPGPARARTTVDDDSDSESNPPDSEGMKARLRELVERRRRDRLAAEEEELDAAQDRLERLERGQGGAPLSDLFNDEEEVDLVAEDKLTQHARPARKASKKALEDMSRETQRMSRNMQLTHQAKTRKKYTTADFLSRFGAPPKVHSSLVNVESAADSSSVAAPESDTERAVPEGTPPSSPPSTHGDELKSTTNVTGVVPFHDADLDDEELPEMGELRSSQNLARMDKGKAPIRPQAVAPVKPQEPKQKRVVRQFRIVPPPKPTQHNPAPDDSDSDIEIVQGDRVSAIFASVGPSTTAESRPLHMLRHLAHLNHSEKPRLKKGAKPSMTPNQLEAELRRRAKIQAIKDREERLAILKAKGIVIMTEEDKEKDQVYIENMLEKARAEAAALGKKERKARKEAGLERDDGLPSSDESEDEDFVGSDEEEGGEGEDVEDVEMSGSEEEEEQEEEGEESGNGLIENEADEEDADQEELEHEAVHADEMFEEALTVADAADASQMEATPQAPLRRARVKRVVEDDDDEPDNVVITQKLPPPATSDCINDDLAAAFGFGPAPAMGVSQMFAGTMANTQDSIDEPVHGSAFIDTEEDALDMLRQLPSAPLPTFLPAADTQYSPDDSFVRDSQTAEESQGINLHSSLLQETPSMQRTTSISQFGDMDFTPSQDVGMRADATPLKINFAEPHSTQDTVLMDVPESPGVPQPQRRGRLFRRPAAVQDDGDDEVATVTPAPAANNAFEAMRKAASKAERKTQQAEFDKKASEARRMVEEQAEESEDEYAGLGGASDDEALADLDVADEADKAMIDESEITVNERELAAFYAEKARNADEAQTSKLYRDLMSGAMRRKRGGAGGAFDIDSDEDEQMAERRRRKQREEARKRRLLLQDESVGKLGANEKKEAFLRAIEDRDDDGDDDMDDVIDEHDGDDESTPTDTQDIAPQDGEISSQQPLQETSANAMKRKVPSAQHDSTGPVKRARTSLRRNPLEAFRAPRSLEEIRDSLSFLIEDAHVDPEANGTAFMSDDDDDDEYSTAAATRAPARDRRTGPRSDVVDRLTLKKQSSSVLSGAGTTGAEAMAFAKPALPSTSSFSKAPSLLRRATTNGSTLMPPPPRRTSAMQREDSGGVVGGAASGAVRMGGSKKSSINYQAREAERKSVLERAERKRKEGVKRIAGMRRGGSGGGSAGGLKSVFGGGGFE